MPISLQKMNHIMTWLSNFSSFDSSFTSKMRVGHEHEILMRNRRKIDRCLRRVGSAMGKKISFNSEGIAYFSHGKFVVLTELSSDCPDTVFVYTLVCLFKPTDNIVEILHTAMQLNYLGLGTKGNTLGIEGNEISLCYSCPVTSVSARSLGSILETFVQTAVEVNQQLDAAKTS